MDKKNFQLSVVFAAVYFFSLNGLGALPNLSLTFILKEQMKLGPAEMAYFQAITLLAWVVKPLWGFISDTFPLFGYKRKSYLILTSAFAAASWMILSLTPVLTFEKLLLVISFGYMAYAFQDVVTDGLMVDKGRQANLTAQFQSIQWCAVYAAMILTSFGGGFISDLGRKGILPYKIIFLITASFPILTLLLAARFVGEEKKEKLKIGKPSIPQVFFKKEIWILSFFLFFWNFSPSFGAPFFYYSVDTLKFSGSFLGILQGVTSIAMLIGSLVFGKYIANFPMRKVLVFAVFLGVAVIFLHFIYFIPFLITHSVLLKGISLGMGFLLGLLNAVIFLQLLNLAAKAAPEESGAMVFALLMSFYNLGLMGSSALGGLLFPLVGLKPLIVISAVFSMLVLFFMPALPIEEELTPVEKGIRRLLARR